MFLLFDLYLVPVPVRCTRLWRRRGEGANGNLARELGVRTKLNLQIIERVGWLARETMRWLDYLRRELFARTNKQTDEQLEPVLGEEFCKKRLWKGMKAS